MVAQECLTVAIRLRETKCRPRKIFLVNYLPSEDTFCTAKVLRKLQISLGTKTGLRTQHFNLYPILAQSLTGMACFHGTYSLFGD